MKEKIQKTNIYNTYIFVHVPSKSYQFKLFIFACLKWIKEKFTHSRDFYSVKEQQQFEIQHEKKRSKGYHGSVYSILGPFCILFLKGGVLFGPFKYFKIF